MTRYLITVDGHGAKLRPIYVSGKSLVDAETARLLVRDMYQMQRRMQEMTRRLRSAVPTYTVVSTLLSSL